MYVNHLQILCWPDFVYVHATFVDLQQINHFSQMTSRLLTSVKKRKVEGRGTI